MKSLKEYTIQFVGLKIGEHHFDYRIEKSFFDHFGYDEFNDVDVKVDVVLVKKATLLDLDFKINGYVNVNCDVTNEPYNQDIHSINSIVVKFGQEFNDENEDILILPHGEYEINIAQYIYEFIALAVPAKRIHPGVEDGSLKSDILEKLDELSPKQKEDNASEDIDPRWEKLKKLLTDK